MKLDIKKYGEPILRGKTVKIKDPSAKDVQDLILNMLETMKANNGVGLAAPQIGSNLRLCLIDVDGAAYVVINPQITAASKTKVISEEGCLSFPGKFFPIARHASVQVRFLDQEGVAQKIKASGLLARAFQHEIDHLDGVLIIDRIKKTRQKKTDTAKNKMIKDSKPNGIQKK